MNNVSFRGKCARMGNTLKLPSPTTLARLGHFPPTSQAGRLVLVYVFSLVRILVAVREAPPPSSSLVANCGELCIYGYRARTCRHCVCVWGRRKLQHSHFFNPAPQSRQSAWLFLQSSELGLPSLSPASECSSPPRTQVGGGGGGGPPPHSVAGERLGESQFRRGDRHCGTLGIYVHCALCSHNIKLLSKRPLYIVVLTCR
jgi:hypothetical protein